MKKSLFAVFVSAVFVILGAVAAQAQPYPSHPIQLLTPGTPGLMQDVTCRLFGEEIGKTLNAQIIVMNKPGASMTLATDAVARAKKDGYTLLYASATPFVYAPVTNPKVVPYDPLKDLEPLGGEAVFPFTVTVQQEAPWKTFAELVDYAKKNPGKLRVATPGPGSTDNFNVQVVQSLTGAQFTHVPMASGPAIALLGGHVELTFSPISEASQYVKAGKLRLLLLSNKMAQFPNVPTIRDFGYKQDLIRGWFAFFAPAGIPDEARKALVPAVEKAFKNPVVKAKVEELEYIVDYKSPAEFKKALAEEYEIASGIAAKLGLKK
ncbi:MAG: tripartite tricarboxylate transporter substrate binding protein [Deltaproteobacteria bacterium]